MVCRGLAPLTRRHRNRREQEEQEEQEEQGEQEEQEEQEEQGKQEEPEEEALSVPDPDTTLLHESCVSLLSHKHCNDGWLEGRLWVVGGGLCSIKVDNYLRDTLCCPLSR